MNIQIFGLKKCFDTKKTERYFKERKINYQLINLTIKGVYMGAGLVSVRFSDRYKALPWLFSFQLSFYPVCEGLHFFYPYLQRTCLEKLIFVHQSNR